MKTTTSDIIVIESKVFGWLGIFFIEQNIIFLQLVYPPSNWWKEKLFEHVTDMGTSRAQPVNKKMFLVLGSEVPAHPIGSHLSFHFDRIENLFWRIYWNINTQFSHIRNTNLGTVALRLNSIRRFINIHISSSRKRKTILKYGFLVFYCYKHEQSIRSHYNQLV